MRGQSLTGCLPLLAVMFILASVVPGLPPTTGLATGDTTEKDTEAVYGVDVDPDNVLLRTAIRPDGTGEWRVEYRIRLDDENTTEAFREHQDDIQANPERYIEAFGTDIRATVRTAENATGRTMSVSDVTVAATTDRLPQQYGVITYTFEWHGFATTNETTIDSGDALEGMFLDRETTFIVTWPDPYHRVSVLPEPTEDRENGVVWEGPLHFASDRPRLLVSTEGEPPANGGDGTDPGDGGGLAGGGSNALLLLAGGLIVVLVAVGTLAWAIRREALDLPAWLPLGTETDPAIQGAELMSNEEQVETLLEDNGGRLKQQEVAERLGWTDAKTSKVVRQMREDEAIETFRIGRENVVVLPGTDVDNSDT